jgi:hypothetical protein
MPYECSKEWLDDLPDALKYINAQKGKIVKIIHCTEDEIRDFAQRNVVIIWEETSDIKTEKEGGK